MLNHHDFILCVTAFSCWWSSIWSGVYHCQHRQMVSRLCCFLQFVPAVSMVSFAMIIWVVRQCFRKKYCLVMQLNIAPEKWSLGDDRLIAAGAYPSFCSIKRLGVFLLPLDGMLVHLRSLLCNFLDFPTIRRYPFIPGWREALWKLRVLPKNTTQCPRPGLEPSLLDPGMSALTMRPTHLHIALKEA